MSLKLHNGDLVIVIFPFTKHLASKVRPALIVSSDSINKDEEDFTVLFISSVIPEKPEDHELVFYPTHPDFKKSGLKKESVFITHKLATIQKKLIKRKIGILGETIRQELAHTFGKAIVI